MEKFETNEIPEISKNVERENNTTRELIRMYDMKTELIEIGRIINSHSKIDELRGKSRNSFVSIGELENSIIMAILRRGNNKCEIYEIPCEFYHKELIIGQIYDWAMPYVVSDTLTGYDSIIKE